MPLRTNLLIGQMLLDAQAVTPEELERGLKEQQKTKSFICTTLVKLGLATEDRIFPILANQLGIPYIKLKGMKLSPKVIEKVPARFASHYHAMPMAFEDGTLTMAVTDPLDIQMLDDLRLLLGVNVRPALAWEGDILEAIHRYYGVGADTIERMMDEGQPALEPAVVRQVTENIEELAQDASVIRLVNQIMLQAHRDRATDIHIEPYEDDMRIRFRIDGLLYEVNIPGTTKYFHAAIISRIKIMSNLNIAERRLPQDGRIKVKVGDQEQDLRVSILPTPFGEAVVIRLLATNVLFNLDNLGLLPQDREILEETIKKPHGIVFVSGPTGSGKSTTLYAVLSRMNAAERKIIAIEDPIEYQIKGVTQIQVNPKIGLTFANGLRSMLRHNPDVMMVGEVRDYETSEITIRVALTGHLVFSTLHTNDAAGAVTRLLDMGVEPFLVASSCELLIAQRLVRLICPQCKQPVSAPHQQELLREFGLPAGERTRQAGTPGDKRLGLFEGRGCDACKQTGYQGRTAIFEMLKVTDAIRELVLQRASSTHIKRKAIEEGMRTLRQDGWEKIKQGLTTVAEVLRVAQQEELPEA